MIPEALEEGVRTHAPTAIYLNPLQNLTTITIPERRRAEICDIARKHGVMIVEDDAYGFADPWSALAAIAPDACWHVAGLAKCIGAGLRLVYVIAGHARRLVVQQRDACARHGLPITAAVATRWITDGTADMIPVSLGRDDGARKIASRWSLAHISRIPRFNWLPMRNGWTRSAFVSHVRPTGLESFGDVCTASGPPPEAVRAPRRSGDALKLSAALNYGARAR